MNKRARRRHGPSRWTTVIPLVLLAVGATAQTVSSGEELREALKAELTPLRLSIKEQARAVATEMAENVIAELATAMTLTASKPQLAARDGSGSEDDNS